MLIEVLAADLQNNMKWESNKVGSEHEVSRKKHLT